MTNILASLVVMVVTNIYSPKQYLQVTIGMSYPPQRMERWVDEPFGGMGFGGFAGIGEVQTRDNPDVQYEEVREIKKFIFMEHGIPDFVISDTLKSKVKKTRVVKEAWESEAVDVPPKVVYGLATNVIRFGTQVYTNTLITVYTNTADRLEAR